MMLTLCNELLAGEGKSLAEQARIAAALGYGGLEIAPGTLAAEPHRITAAAARAMRAAVEDEGLVVTGLHWLLAPYPALSITEPEKAGPTRDVLTGLLDLCAELGGRVMVHGSPGQRRPPAGEAGEVTLARVAAFFAPVAEAAAARNLSYCIEPLAPRETPFINTVAEAAALVAAVGAPSFLTMIDTSAAAQAEAEPVADVIRRWVPTGLIGHVHLNDSNRGAPGMGDDPFPAIMAALREVGWDRPMGVEPFRTLIDATVTAAIGAATIRACRSAAS